MVLSIIISIVKFFGILKMLEMSYRTIWFVQRHIRSTSHLTKRYGKGSWALITGATDGLGKEMALELASLGFNIVLVSRNKDKL